MKHAESIIGDSYFLLLNTVMIALIKPSVSTKHLISRWPRARHHVPVVANACTCIPSCEGIGPLRLICNSGNPMHWRHKEINKSSPNGPGTESPVARWVSGSSWVRRWVSMFQKDGPPIKSAIALRSRQFPGFRTTAENPLNVKRTGKRG